jgi:glycosyltransferase involved in cell wall biosynthesis
MASGCPVITTRCGSLGEVAGDAACLVDPDDAGAIGRAIVGLSSNDRRAELQRAGFARAAEFSCEEQARQSLRIFARLLS